MRCRSVNREQITLHEQQRQRQRGARTRCESLVKVYCQSLESATMPRPTSRATPTHRGPLESLNLRDIIFPPSDEPLRQDVHLLGDLVGKVIREQGGDKLFESVERARHAAIRRREGGEDDDPTLRHALTGLPAAEAAEIVRAFSTYFQVVNLDERVHRIRRGRARMREDGPPQDGSLADTVSRLQALGRTPEQIAGAFHGARVEPVFTAHPTESTRRIILEKQGRIASELIARLDPSRTPHDERISLALIRDNITTAWQTEEHPTTRPTVVDEREHVLYYVTNVLYPVLPVLHERLDDALRAVGVTPTVSVRLSANVA